MKVVFSSRAWDQYTYWATADPKILKRINRLIKEIQRTPFEGAGKPEPLKENLSGWWSRRITDEHRLVYRVKDEAVQIAQARYHY
ncbi:Txe/YoeB family addiction module toxin [Streptomyces sp. NPDC046712]|uniref:Txe/YoeB family addiction module toxin n=1 Tax=Streptomyces sp. NPDC046712 TaxID=3154802 RepID=UPI0034072255